MTTRECGATVRERDGTAIIDLTGDVNSAAEEVLDAAYDEAARDHDQVALNFADVDYINSTGIALIVGLLARARRTGVGIRAFGLSEHYRGIFEITRLSDFMTITDDENGAVGVGGKSSDD